MVKRHCVNNSTTTNFFLFEGNNTLHMLCYYGKVKHLNQDGSLGDSAYSVIVNFLNERQIMGQFEPYMVNLSTAAADKKSNSNRKVSPLKARNNDGFSPFLLAVNRGHVNVLDTLVEEIWSVSLKCGEIF